jgi:hypothetical protein
VEYQRLARRLGVSDMLAQNPAFLDGERTMVQLLARRNARSYPPGQFNFLVMGQQRQGGNVTKYVSKRIV